MGTEDTREKKVLEPGKALASSRRLWEDRNLALLETYIAIPNKSPHFDASWKEHGHMDRAVKLYEQFANERKQVIPGMSVEVVEIKGKTPLIHINIPGTLPKVDGKSNGKKLLMYGHLDKQPECDEKDEAGNGGWKDGLGPWTPVRRGDRLYGRGGADDGYAMPAALTAYELLAEQGVPYADCTIIIEASEESGSPDLPEYLELLAPEIGTPDMIMCLDSGAGDYDRLWNTTSLRGLVAGTLSVKILTEGVHSGSGSGIIPDSHLIASQVLERVRDPKTGKVLLPEFHIDIPPQRVQEAKDTAELLGDGVYSEFPFVEGAGPLHSDNAQLLLDQTWGPAITVIGADGLPSTKEAGNVLNSGTRLRLSTRIPPGVNAEEALKALKETLEKDPPYGAEVTFDTMSGSAGWNAPQSSEWLTESVNGASEDYFGKPAVSKGEGGSIPFMKMLGDKFPEAQFLITGVLGPESNAHGPNEFLEIEYVKKLNAAVAAIVADHAVGDSGA